MASKFLTLNLPIVSKSLTPILAQAEAAARQDDWATVSDCLQHWLSQADCLVADGLPLALQGLISGDFQVRWEIAQLLPNFGDAAIAPVIALLQNAEADPAAQWFAIRVLGQFAHPDVIPALVKVLETATDAELHRMAITALARLGEAAIVVLGHRLSHASQRPLATQALAEIRQPATIPWLLSVVSDEQAEVRARAIAALGHFSELRLLPVLLAALTDRAASVRQAAVTALGFWATADDQADIVRQLCPLLLDPNLGVGQQTAIALSRWGNAQAIAALTKVLAAPQTPEPLALEVGRALGWIGQASALQGLQQAWQSPLSDRVQQEIVMILGRVEPLELQPQASQILVYLLDHPTQTPAAIVKPMIALALGQLRQAEALEPLMQLLAEPDESLRWHVMAALKLGNVAIAHQRLKELAAQENISSALAQGIAIVLQEWQP